MITLLCHRSALPRRPGVYAVWWLGWQYVGMSRNLRQRWCGPTPHHRQPQLPPWSILVWRCYPGRVLRDQERRWIRRLRPALNGTPVPRRRRLAVPWRLVAALTFAVYLYWRLRYGS
jgi:hypothetical protein